MTLSRFSLLFWFSLVAGVIFAPRARAQSGGIALGAYYYLADGLCAPGDVAAVNAWRNNVGRLPAVWSIYQSWTGWNEFPISHARRANALGGRLMLTWEPWDGGARDGNWSSRTVASGAYDAYVRSYARAVKASGVPVMIRLAHEMNGDWYPWGTAYANNGARHNGNVPGDYVMMWRRVVQIFRAEGANNVSWVWAPNIVYQTPANSLQQQIADLRALYPGDDVVDWIGLSVYNDGARRPWRSFSQLFDGSYQIITSLTDKPMMVAEVGVTEQGAPNGQSKAQWIARTFLQDIPTRYPRVRLVNYFFRDKSSQGESNFRFDSSPDAMNAFRTVVASPIYNGNVAGNAIRASGNVTAVRARAASPTSSYVSAASIRSLQAEERAPAPALSGNNGTLRNGNRRVALPRLRMN